MEHLLRHGVYGALGEDGDDDAADAFLEENIDDMLKRRTRVVQVDSVSGGIAGASFSKATFQADDADANLDVDDPDFWTKVRAGAPVCGCLYLFLCFSVSLSLCLSVSLSLSFCC